MTLKDWYLINKEYKILTIIIGTFNCILIRKHFILFENKTHKKVKDLYNFWIINFFYSIFFKVIIRIFVWNDILFFLANKIDFVTRANKIDQDMKNAILFINRIQYFFCDSKELDYAPRNHCQNFRSLVHLKISYIPKSVIHCKL